MTNRDDSFNTDRAQELIQLAQEEIESLRAEWIKRCERRGKTPEQTQASVSRIDDKHRRIVDAIKTVDSERPGAIDALSQNPIIANDADAVELEVSRLLQNR